MKKYYKVQICSEYINLLGKPTTLIVEKGFIYAKEIVSKERFMICDNKSQGYCYDYYVLNQELNLENQVRLKDIIDYIRTFKLDEFPVYTKYESRMVQQAIKKLAKENK